MPRLDGRELRCTRYRCDERMVRVDDPIGRITFVCRACERNKAGLCRDCPKRLAAKRAQRCAECKTTHDRALDTEYAKRTYKDPKVRARRLREQKATRERRSEARRAEIAARMAKWYRDHPRSREPAEQLYQHVWWKTRGRDLRAQRRAAKDLSFDEKTAKVGSSPIA